MSDLSSTAPQSIHDSAICPRADGTVRSSTSNVPAEADSWPDAPPYIASRAVAITRDIAIGITRVVIGGYAEEGDCEPMWFAVVADVGALLPWQFRSNAGTRRWELRARGWVTPEMFGARRDAVTNDRQAIVDAATYLAAAGGGEVQFLSGTYYVTDSIALANMTGISLVARVPRLTTIKIPQVATPGGGLSSHIIVVTNCSHFSICGLTLIGNREISQAYTAFCGIYLITCQHYKILNCAIMHIESIGISINTVCDTGEVSGNHIFDCSSGIWFFKGNVNADVVGNRIDKMQIHGILTDDATSADVSPATSRPNYNIRIVRNYITNFSISGGSGAGIVMSGQLGGCISDNDIAVGGVEGVSAALGILLNSGQDTYNPTLGTEVGGNRIHDIYGGGGITLQGANVCSVVGNTMWNLYLWPTALAGAAISILRDTPGTHTVALQGTDYNIIGANTIRGNGNTQVAVQLGPGVLFNVIHKQQCSGTTAGDLVVSPSAGQGQISFQGYGPLPAWNAGWRGAQWLNTVDDKLYIATNLAWIVVGTQA